MKTKTCLQLFGFLAALTVSSAAIADGPIDMTCVTQVPTTSIIADATGNEMRVRVLHHNGVKYMPIYNGILTPNDVPMITDRASKLAKLGTNYEIRFKKASCKQAASGRFECFDGEPTTINGVKVEPWAVHTSRVRTESIAGVTETLQVHLSLRLDGESQVFSMAFDPSECLIQ